jgi:hypothetical protein
MVTITSLIAKVLMGYINLGEGTRKPSPKLAWVSILLKRQNDQSTLSSGSDTGYGRRGHLGGSRIGSRGWS